MTVSTNSSLVSTAFTLGVVIAFQNFKTRRKYVVAFALTKVIRPWVKTSLQMRILLYR
jgi:hypothetical protein